MTMETPAFPDTQPGFRVTADTLSNEDAYQAMMVAADKVEYAALEARRDLLGLGFADSHSLCVELDRTAGQYAVVREAVRRQANPVEGEAGVADV